MSQKNHDALVKLKLELKTNVKMFQLLDILEEAAGGFMSKAEAVNVRGKSGDADQMGALIEILLGKGDAQFLTFCTMLERSGHKEWAYELKLAAGICNPGQGIFHVLFRVSIGYPCQSFFTRISFCQVPHIRVHYMMWIYSYCNFSVLINVTYNNLVQFIYCTSQSTLTYYIYNTIKQNIPTPSITECKMISLQ